MTWWWAVLMTSSWLHLIHSFSCPFHVTLLISHVHVRSIILRFTFTFICRFTLNVTLRFVLRHVDLIPRCSVFRSLHLIDFGDWFVAVITFSLFPLRSRYVDSPLVILEFHTLGDRSITICCSLLVIIPVPLLLMLFDSFFIWSFVTISVSFTIPIRPLDSVQFDRDHSSHLVLSVCCCSSFVREIDKWNWLFNGVVLLLSSNDQYSVLTSIETVMWRR